MNKRLGRQLDRAKYASLNSRAISEEARALVSGLCARVDTWEHKRRKRIYRRRKIGKFVAAVEAFAADLVKARGDSVARGWAYRSLHAKSFTGQHVSHRSFVRLVNALCGLGLVERKTGFQSKVDFGTGPVVYIAKASRFKATPAFIALAKHHGVDPAYAVDHFTEELPDQPIRLRKASAESEAKRPVIPTEGGHPIRSKAATDSDRRRPPC